MRNTNTTRNWKFFFRTYYILNFSGYFVLYIWLMRIPFTPSCLGITRPKSWTNFKIWDERAALNLKSWNDFESLWINVSRYKSDLYDVDENVYWRVDGQHEMVPLSEQICPLGPKSQLTIFEHLVSFVDVRDQLCEVAEEKHEDDPGKKTCHCRIPAMAWGDWIVDQIRPVRSNAHF